MPMRYALKCLVFIAFLLAASTPAVVVRSAAVDNRVVLAAKAADTALVKRLIRQGVPVNVSEGDGSTPLLWAAYFSDREMAQALISAGADVKKANDFGMTPLLQASRLGDAAIMEMLLKAGASASELHGDGETPIMAAAGAGSVEGVRLLLTRGADANARDHWQGQTPLMWAAGEGHLPVVRALLEGGANVNIVADASELQHRPTAFRGRSFVDFPTGGLTALMTAAREGHLEVVAALLDAGANTRVANPDGATALMIAVLNDRLDVASLLLDRGANADDGSLFQAVELHNLAPDATVGDATRPRPEHTNRISTLDLIAKLLQKGASPDRVFDYTLHLGQTRPPANPRASAFYRAAQSQDVAALKLMAAHGANPNLAQGATSDGFGAPNVAGVTPLMIAMGAGGGGGRGGGARFREEADRGALEAVTAIIAAGADVNLATPQGDTPLHRAAQAGNVQLIELLAGKGAVLDTKNKAGLTPLDVAMGKQPPAAPAGPGAGLGGRGGAPMPQPAAAAALRRLMGLPAEN